MTDSLSIGDYLIKRIYELGVGHVFGVPGDYALSLFHKLEESPIAVVNTCDEQGAGFAANAYAQLKGLGVACVTYGVGGLKLANTTAQAFAEKIPVLIISGAPGISERQKYSLLHHKVNQYDDQLRIFEHLTVASALLSDPDRAHQEIDDVLDSMLRLKGPGYIELPRDLVSLVPDQSSGRGRSELPKRQGAQQDQGSQQYQDTLQEALAEAIDIINASKQPVIIAGLEVERFGWVDEVLELAWKANIPIAATILGKSVVPEGESLYMGIYAGALGDQRIREYVEGSDCIIMIGVFLTDLDMGAYTAHLDLGKVIYTTSRKTSIHHHQYSGLGRDFLDKLAEADLNWHDPGPVPYPRRPEPIGSELCPDQRITANRLFQIIGAFLDDKTVLIADVGDALFGSIEIATTCNFLSSAYYASLGFAVPASIGVQLACPDARPLALSGDGSFQMTGMEFSTAARYGLNPIIVVLNNGGYGTERPMLDGDFNDIPVWQYSKIPAITGSGKGFLVKTERDLADALEMARAEEDPCILEVILAKDDISEPLKRLTRALRRNV
jgi:TPP-dependent 2-oxoacid decarboxylase